MAKFESNLFSKASGKLTGIVFGRARTRQGKVMTARELVIPLNPQTVPQQANRDLFKRVLAIVQDAGPGVYRSDWDRGVEKLPGYQSLFSRYMLAGHWDGNLPGAVFDDPPPDTELGDLHFPATFTMSDLGSGDFRFNWSTETGTNGQATDIPVFGMVGEEPLVNGSPFYFIDFQVGTDQGGSVDRSDGQAVFSSPENVGNGVLVFLYFRPVDDTFTTQPSLAKWQLRSLS